jgi:hypothetical protein
MVKGFIAVGSTVGTLLTLSQTPQGKAAIALGAKLTTNHPTSGQMSRTFVENLDRI